MISRLAMLLLIMGLMASTAGAEERIEDTLPEPPEGMEFKLIWSDEFDGTEIDETKWTIQEGKRRDDWWSEKAVGLDGEGHLIISVMRDGDRYISGAIRSTGKFEHDFGYYVARIQLQRQWGHWTAFWLTGPGTGNVNDEGRDGTEIDIYEKFDIYTMVQHNLHWNGYGEEHQHAGKVLMIKDIMEGYHTFALWWTPDEYIFYIDGKETWRTDAGGVCQVPNHVAVSNEIGKLAGDITKAELPDFFVTDYVRVYDLVDKIE